MERLIPMVNKLQDVFSAVGADFIQLPQIVVVGAQSSGKSSVLESLVGRDFLPRGAGIVTRRPLVLQLVNVPPEQDFQEWGEFLHVPGQAFVRFEDIRTEIEAETAREAGSNKGISETPIHLKICSPNVVDLTLVDLPGITKVPVGDQPDDIEARVRGLIRRFIANENSIILAVSAANTDIANSDALQLAKEVDPLGQRTLGVITKLDLMDAGTDSFDLLTDQGAVRLQLGFVGVVNRSQRDIQSNKPIRKAQRAETEYFSSHPRYRNIAHRCGTAYLGKTLSRLLMNHIRDCLPDLKTRINALATQTQQRFATYGDPLLDNFNKGGLLLQVITKFCSDYCRAVDGTASEIETNELTGGARICYIFHETFGRTTELLDPLDGLTVADIRTAIRNATGPRPSLFVPEVSFELLVKRQMRRLLEPSMRCVELVFEEMLRIVHQCEVSDLQRFDNLRSEIRDEVVRMLRERLLPTNTMVENLLAIELAYINTNHPDFLGGSQAVTSIVERRMDSERRGRPASAVNDGAGRSGLLRVRQDENIIMDDSSAGVGLGAVIGGGGMDSASARRKTLSRPASAISDGGGIMSYLFGDSKPSPSVAGDRARPLDAKAASRDRASEVADANARMPTLPPVLRDDRMMSSREQMETELIQSLIVSYFTIVRKNVQDAVPKIIMHFLVNWMKEHLQSRLVSTLYREDRFEPLLHESPQVVEKRRETKKLMSALDRAAQVLTQVSNEANESDDLAPATTAASAASTKPVAASTITAAAAAAPSTPVTRR